MADQSPGECHLESLRGRQKWNPDRQRSSQEDPERPKERRVSRATITARWGREFTLDPVTWWFLHYGWYSGNQSPQGYRKFSGTF